MAKKIKKGLMMKKQILLSLIVTALLGLNGCTDDKKVSSDETNSSETNPMQYISYTFNNQAQFVEAKEDGNITDVSKHLATINRGEEGWINISPNGEWLLLDSTRLDSECTGWGCLIYGKRDLSEFKTIKTVSESVIHTEGFSAISSSGNLIVAHMSGTNRNDLFVSIKGTNDRWSELRSITSDSPSDNNRNPALSADGKEVLFDCGTSICMVNSDGTNLQTLISSDNTAFDLVRYADFDTTGNIVFEGDDGTERIWRYNRTSKQLSMVDESKRNDNSPCVLSDGHIASLWMERQRQGDSIHELKIMTDSNYTMVIKDKDITDSGIGCGGL